MRLRTKASAAWTSRSRPTRSERVSEELFSSEFFYSRVSFRFVFLSFPLPLSLLLHPPSNLTVLPALPEEHVRLHDQLTARQPGVVLEELHPVGVCFHLFLLKFFFVEVEVEKGDERSASRKREISTSSLSLCPFSLFFFYASFSWTKVSISAYRNRETKKPAKPRKAHKGFENILFFDLDGSRSNQFHFQFLSLLPSFSSTLTCTVLSGRSSPARRLMCSRRRRFESCSRIFLRAIFEKERERGKKSRVKRRNEEK